MGEKEQAVKNFQNFDRLSNFRQTKARKIV